MDPKVFSGTSTRLTVDQNTARFLVLCHVTVSHETEPQLRRATVNATNKHRNVTNKTTLNLQKRDYLVKVLQPHCLVYTILNSSKGSHLSIIHDIPLRSKLALSASLRRVCIKALYCRTLFCQTLPSLIRRLILHSYSLQVCNNFQLINIGAKGRNLSSWSLNESRPSR